MIFARAWWLAVLVGGLVFGCAGTVEDEGPDPLPDTAEARKPYLGVALTDDPAGGCAVAAIMPGPLLGEAGQPGPLEAGDLILRVDGQPVTAGTFREVVSRHQPGEVVRLDVVKNGVTKPGTVATTQATTAPTTRAATQGMIAPATQAVAPPGSVRTIKVTLAARGQWAGPLVFPRRRRDDLDADRIVPTPGGLRVPGAPGAPGVPGDPGAPGVPGIPGAPTTFEELLTRSIDEHHLREPYDQLSAFIKKTQDDAVGFHTLSRVWYGFQRPTRLMELQRTITDPLPAVAADPARVLAVMAANLDAKPPVLGAPIDMTDPQTAVEQLAQRIEAARADLERAFAGLSPAQRARLVPRMTKLLAQQANQGDEITTQAQARELLRTTRASMKIDYDALLQAAGDLAGLMRKQPPETAQKMAQAGRTMSSLPWELRGAVTGEVLAAKKTSAGWIVCGGPGPNTYDMTRIAAVIDVGGDDTYRWPSGGTSDGARVGAVQVILDLAGNDRYLGGVQRPTSNVQGARPPDVGPWTLDVGPASGPAGIIGGVSLIVDQDGDDVYGGGPVSLGAGVCGVGILLDMAGNDTYKGTSWTQGVGFYGAGALIDQGDGSDTYIAQTFGQGVGGPRGFGLLLDEKGRDLYRLNGPQPSNYGTPAVFAGMGQGLGYGLRNIDTGGIGILADLAGDDRYEAGEFSQGCGYFWGLGLLWDRSGNDLYYGNRYSQGVAAHQAIGILADDAGDDTYWAMTAAAQGAAWDIALGLLIDRGGNDSYQAEGLAQGSAAMQGMAFLIDLDGVNRFVSPAPCQGQSGSNQYHFEQSGCYSFSVLLSAGGQVDYYSSGRGNGRTVTAEGPTRPNPAEAFRHGLFIDTVEKVELWKMGPSAGSVN